MAKQIGRSELYDRIWSEPMTKVAADLGVSDVGLKKACTRHKIPTPKRGYWAKKAAGQTLTKDVLPKLREEIRFLERVSFDFAPDRERSAGLREFRQSQRADRSASPRGSLKLPPFPRVDRPLPLLRATVKKLRHGKPDDGGIRAHDAGECGVHVSPATAERAIAILDALFRSLQDKGWKIEADGGATKATGQLGSLQFQLKELYRVIDHVPTSAELELEKKDRARKSGIALHPLYYRPPWPPKDRIWTGLLKLEIIGSHLDIRRSWNDARTQTIEGLLPQIVEGFATFLFYRAEKEKEEAEKARRRAHLLKRRELAAARHEREVKREELLDEITDIAVRVQRLDVWLTQTNPLPEQPELVRMLTWAKEQRGELQSLLNGARLNELLRSRQLFPDDAVDPLHDPEGDPPSDIFRW